MMEICKEVVDQTVKEFRAGGFDISDEEVRRAKDISRCYSRMF